MRWSLIDHDQRERRRVVDAGNGLADGDAFNAGHAMMSPVVVSVVFRSLEALK